jgi:hypothetical protein
MQVKSRRCVVPRFQSRLVDPRVAIRVSRDADPSSFDSYEMVCTDKLICCATQTDRPIPSLNLGCKCVCRCPPGSSSWPPWTLPGVAHNTCTQAILFPNPCLPSSSSPSQCRRLHSRSPSSVRLPTQSWYLRTTFLVLRKSLIGYELPSAHQIYGHRRCPTLLEKGQ